MTADAAELAARLAAELRRVGVGATPDRGARLAQALRVAPPATHDDLYWLARVTLLDDRDRLPAFDAVLARLRAAEDLDPTPPSLDAPDAHPPLLVPDRGPAVPVDGTDGDARDGRGGAHVDEAAPVPTPDPGAPHRPRSVVTASDVERLRSRDFATLSADELARLRGLMRRLRLEPPLRVGRRDRRHPSGDRPDLRATLRRARRTAGDPVGIVRRRSRPRRRRLVVLCDVSGSMAPYARAYLQLLTCAAGGADAEAFVFATRLTRVTRDLRRGGTDAALARVAARVPDWSSGTRIGASLRTFLAEHGRRGAARGAVVVIVSDGWERGDVTLLADEMRRLRRLAHRVVWINPRRATEGFAPLARGMAAALPSIDRLVSGHTFDALDEVLGAISEEGRAQ